MSSVFRRSEYGGGWLGENGPARPPAAPHWPGVGARQNVNSRTRSIPNPRTSAVLYSFREQAGWARPTVAPLYKRLLILLFSAVLTFGGAVALDPGPTAQSAHSAQQRGGDRDCGDFNTQAAAQNVFLDHGGPDSDPHALDADGDGIACESNPCPCSYDTGGGGGGGGGGGDNPPKTLRQKAFVIRVIDGDTVKVKLKGGPRRHVRILGIDTPEMSGSGECGSLFATRSAREFMPRGSLVLLISDTTHAS